MVSSTGITILPIYLDCTERFAHSGGVTRLEDDTIVHESEDNKNVFTFEKSDRALQSWQLTLSDHDDEDARFVWELFRVCRNSKGFLLVPPLEEDRVLTNQPLQNTTDDSYEGDGSTTTFQLQYQVTLDHDIGGSESSSDAFDVNYPLGAAQGGGYTVVVYANGTPVTVSGYSQTTGIVTLAVAPADGAAMTASFARAVAVRFVSDSVDRTLFEGSRSEARSWLFKEIP
jgi:hypothetical protein